MVIGPFAVLGSVLLGPGLLAAVIAHSRGYRPWFWVLSLGPVGLIWILSMQNLSKATTPEEREQWESRADWTGGLLSGFTSLFMVALPLLGMAMYLGARTVPAPAVRAVPPPTRSGN